MGSKYKVTWNKVFIWLLAISSAIVSSSGCALLSIGAKPRTNVTINLTTSPTVVHPGDTTEVKLAFWNSGPLLAQFVGGVPKDYGPALGLYSPDPAASLTLEEPLQTIEIPPDRHNYYRKHQIRIPKDAPEGVYLITFYGLPVHDNRFVVEAVSAYIIVKKGDN